MRHLGTLLAALVIAPLAWLLIAFGQERSVSAFAATVHAGSGPVTGLARPLLCLVGAGLLLGLIATLRFSPAGALLAGAVYLVSYLPFALGWSGAASTLSHHVSVLGRQADPTTPIQTGMAPVLGAALLVSVASVGRWRRWPQPADEVSAREPLDFDRDERPLGADGLEPSSPSWSDSTRGSSASGFGSYPARRGAERERNVPSGARWSEPSDGPVPDRASRRLSRSFD